MNRVAIFAHYDKDNIIDDYVIYYLQSLKELFSKIIFVSDSDLSENETNKIKEIVDYIQAYHHGEYDFGSYKYGYIVAKENNLLETADELLLCNDSVYGPIFPLKSFFDEMSNKDCEFYGLYENKVGLASNKDDSHLQSWFLLLKKKVFLSNEFHKFITSVTRLDEKTDIIQKYEIGFTKEMAKQFKYTYAFTSEQSNAVVAAAPLLISSGFPFLKCVVYRKYNIDLASYIPEKLFNMIEKHSLRVNKRTPIKKFFRTLKWKSKMKNYKIIKN